MKISDKLYGYMTMTLFTITVVSVLISDFLSLRWWLIYFGLAALWIGLYESGK